MKKLALVTVASLFVFACSSAPSDPPVAGGQKSSTSATDKSDDDNGGTQGTSSTPSGSSSSGGSSNDSTPGATPDGDDACWDACDAQNPAGAQAMEAIDDQWTSCVCGACAAACGTSLCAANPTEPADGDACDTCMQNAQTCHDAWETACNANAECKKLDTCQTACEPADADEADDADDADQRAKAYSRIRAARTVVRGADPTRVVVRSR